jgi:predicted acylesterase/phospholipase RssA
MNEESESRTNLSSPFGKIALSFSGGGYRAAAFHLGSLDMLNELGLLQDVSALSTVSGGTFTGMRYALALTAGQPYREFYNELKTAFLTVDLPTLAFEKLAAGAPTIPSGRWDVITAFAQVYDEKLFAGKRFGVFWEDHPIPLAELIFNATEFRTAVAFRFRKSDYPNAKIGNGNVFITAEEAKQIRIADIVAASSCFPGGFEPLSFPNDFNWPDNETGRTVLEEIRARDWAPLPIMDGGIYDNQGIGSLMLGGDIEIERFGVFIFSDTDRPRDSIYTLPAPRKPGWLRLRHLNLAWWLLIVLAAVVALFSVYMAATRLHGLYGIFDLLSLAMASGTIAVLFWARTKIIGILQAIPKIGLSAWDSTKDLKVNQFIDMIHLRISSLFALASGVFMRRIRQMVFNSVYKDPRFAQKLVANFIYDLPQAKSLPEPLEWLTPSDKMREVADAANKMDVTLWFNEPQQMKDLIACGQITICYKLLLHIIARKKESGVTAPSDLDATFSRARELFLKLKENPYALVDPP